MTGPSTATHEAQHGAALIALTGELPSRLSIVPRGESLGRCVLRPGAVERHGPALLVVGLAGDVRCGAGGRQDRERSARLALQLAHGDERAASALLRDAQDMARSLLAQPLFREQVARVAAELTRKREMTGNEVLRIMSYAAQDAANTTTTNRSYTIKPRWMLGDGPSKTSKARTTRTLDRDPRAVSVDHRTGAGTEEALSWRKSAFAAFINERGLSAEQGAHLYDNWRTGRFAGRETR